MMPNVELLQSAKRRMPRHIAHKPGYGPVPNALVLRNRIAMVMAILEAAETAKGIDPRANAHCAMLRARIAHLPKVWESAFGYAWEDGRVLGPDEWKHSTAGRAMREDVQPMRVMDRRDRLDRYPPWQAARAVCVAIRTDGEREARVEMDRRRQVLREQMRRHKMEESIRTARRTARRWEESQRKAEAERRRQMDELHAFRTGTQKRVRFPNERRKQKVRGR